MDLNGLISEVANYGLPVILLLFVLKKADKYVEKLVHNFSGLYVEMQKIRFLLDNLVSTLTKEKEETPQ